MRLFIVFFIATLFLIACQVPANSVELSSKSNIFFDLKTFFQKEKARLEKLNSFKKSVSINGATETQNLSQLDFENELSIFIASDINRPAWSGKYKTDSIFNQQKELTQINYTSLEESLKTKKIVIDFQQNTPYKISIEKAIDNAVAQSQQTLTYNVDTGYTVQSVQALSLSETKTIIVDVKFIAK